MLFGYKLNEIKKNITGTVEILNIKLNEHIEYLTFRKQRSQCGFIIVSTTSE
jgi:hypothetical protein